MNQVYLLIGGNLGDRYKLIASAKQSITKKIGKIVKESSIYETAPWGFESEQDFLNQVVHISTNLTPKDVLNKCLEIEKELGRNRESEQYSSRTMDVDILFYNDEIIQLWNLIIPHEQLHKRRFTLEPLVEIAPGLIHPVIKKSISDILKECKDNSEVRKL
ncbi:MAG: 2-amino-4-hydroxy-6-hydroxymethyldihydropteridine diphosphokinase [Bacteroidales bacterium]|nr:2-amino-4-hydroxy-6-hydroxymethyldihydropteridine diphosphokinase [Bacteroidales bacterium]